MKWLKLYFMFLILAIHFLMVNFSFPKFTSNSAGCTCQNHEKFGKILVI